MFHRRDFGRSGGAVSHEELAVHRWCCSGRLRLRNHAPVSENRVIRSWVRSDGRRLYIRPRDTLFLTAFAVALLLVTAVAFDGLLNLVSGIVIVVAFLAAGRVAAVR